MQSQLGALAAEEAEHPEGRHRLGGDGSQGGALYSHAESEDKDGVQHNVGHRANEHRGHGDGGKALGGDKEIQAQGQLHKNGAPQVDGEVVAGKGKGVRRSAEEEEHGLLHRQEEGGYQDGEGDEQGGTVAQNGVGLVLLPLSHAHHRTGAASHAHQGGDGGDEHQHRETHPQAGEGQIPHLLDVADVNAVHDVVQGIDQLGGYRGQRQPQQQLADRVPAQIIFSLCHSDYASSFSRK